MSIQAAEGHVTGARGDAPALSPTRRARRERLLAAAFTVLLRHGYRGATMEGIAAEAEVSKVTLYKYFAGKDDVVLALVEDGMLAPNPAIVQRTRAVLEHALLALADGATVDLITQDVLELFEIAAERQSDAFFRLMVEVGFEQPDLAERAKQVALAPAISHVLAVTEPALSGRLPATIDAETLCSLLFSTVTGYTLVQPAVIGMDRPGRERLAAALAYLLCHGLSAPR